MGVRPFAGLGMAVLVAVAAPLGIGAQPATRVAVTLDILTRFPGVYHGRPVAVVAQARELNRSWRLSVPEGKTFLLVPQSGAPPDGTTELRGMFFDLGRLNDEGGLSARRELQVLVAAQMQDQPLARDRVFGLVDATWTDPPAAIPPTLRGIVLDPTAFDGRTVTVRGRFRGQNLFGDLPFWPRHSRWDFVIQSADASMWVTDLRPRGNGFELDPASRRNATTWIEVTGVVRTDAGMPRIEGTRLTRATADEEPPVSAAAPVVVPEVAPSIIFSAPLDGETDVPVGTTVGVQFSRDMAAGSFEDRIRIRYSGDITDAVPAFTTVYRPENRAVEVRFTAPLARGARVIVEFVEGVTASTGTPLPPSQLSFTTQR